MPRNYTMVDFLEICVFAIYYNHIYICLLCSDECNDRPAELDGVVPRVFGEIGDGVISTVDANTHMYTIPEPANDPSLRSDVNDMIHIMQSYAKSASFSSWYRYVLMYINYKL